MDPFHWNVNPEIFQLGPFSVRWYGALFAAGFFCGFLYMRYVYKNENKPVADLDALLLYMVASTIIGARLGHCLFYDPAYYLSNPLEIIMVHRGGLASHGGVIGILIGMYLYAKRRNDQPYLWILDRIAIPATLAGAFIRLGNFFNSEILGKPTQSSLAVVFERIDFLPRHPAQLYESLSYFLIFGVLHFVYASSKQRMPAGLTAGLFFVLVFSARFVIEFFKVRQAAFGDHLPISLGQFLSIPAIIVGIVLLIHSQRQASNNAQVK